MAGAVQMGWRSLRGLPIISSMALRVSVLESPARLRCPCCEQSVDRFLPIPAAYVEECRQRGVEHPLDAWETLNLQAYLCPKCGATDRDRLQVAFLTELVQPGMKVLEFAPSRPVSDWLRRAGAEYRSCDLFMASADDRADITNLACYEDGQFDGVICSHVLEHVLDDLRAMRELRRVLAPGGVAVLLVPISKVVSGVVEDPSCDDEGERWRRFGQGDHVRIYSREGFVGRLVEAGFEVEVWSGKAGVDGALYVGK